MWSGSFGVWYGKFDGWCGSFGVWCGKFDGWCGKLLLNCQRVRHQDVNTCLAETSKEQYSKLLRSYIVSEQLHCIWTAIRIAAGQPLDSLLGSLTTALHDFLDSLGPLL
jgi:hypothetical protein